MIRHSQRLVRPDEFLIARNLMEIKSPQAAYILGFIWADGYLYKKSNTCSIEIIKSDLDVLENIFTSIYPWKKSYRNRPHRQPQGCLYTTNKALVDFLREYKYQNKTVTCPKSIIEKIPIKWQYLWWRGYLDGDGCIYVNKTNHCYQITFAGAYQSDWSGRKEFLDILKVSSNIQFSKKPLSKSSNLRITSYVNCRKLLDYIYQDNIQIGLPRKLQKYEELKNCHLLSRNELSISTGVKPFSIFRKDTNELVGRWQSRRMCAEELNISYGAIIDAIKGKRRFIGVYRIVVETE